MKKRINQLTALAVACMLVFGGCTDKEEEQAVSQLPQIEQEEPAPSPEETVEETVPLRIYIEKNNKTYYFEDGDDAYLYLEYCTVTAEGDEYENLKRNIENWSLERSEGLRSLYASFEETAAEEAQGNEDFPGYSLYQDVTVARADSAVVSLCDETYQYTGGAHGTSYLDGVNFDAQTGKKLEISDILLDYEIFKTDATDRIIYYLQENHGDELFADYRQTVENLWEEGGQLSWYLDGSGIVIVLQEYSVGAYSMGRQEVHLPYSEFKQYIKEAYLPQDAEGVGRFEENQEIYLNLPGFEEAYPMMLQCHWEEEIPTCSLWLGENEKPLDSFAALEGAYLVRNGEEVYCLVEVDMASDDYFTYVYRLTDGVIEEIAKVAAAVDGGNINTDEIDMEFQINLLGTYRGMKTYTFDEKGEFSSADEEYDLVRNQIVLTTTVDLPVTLEGTESTLPSGSHIILNATDAETYVNFTIQETGQTGVLSVECNEEDSFAVTVDGKNADDCFETLPYVG